MPPLVAFRNVEKHFYAPHGRVEVLKGIDFTVESGEFVGITGPSGSGKSTLMNLAAMLDVPSRGVVAFDGMDVSRMADADLCDFRKVRVGMVFQKYCLLPHRSVLDNVLFRFRYVPHDRAEAGKKALQALDLMGLAGIADRPARLLSGGEMQRVAIARAVVLEPRLLVADEPTGNLDGRTAESVMTCFASLNRQGLTVLLVTHNEHLLTFCSRSMRCVDGGLEAAAT